MIRTLTDWYQRRKERERFEREAEQRRLIVMANYQAQDYMLTNVTTYAILSPMFTSSGTEPHHAAPDYSGSAYGATTGQSDMGSSYVSSSSDSGSSYDSGGSSSSSSDSGGF